MPPKVVQKPQRPSTAPNTRVRLRQYQQLVTQLTNTISETKRPPPAGANLDEIVQRRNKLERVLRDVEESIAATKAEQQAHQNARFIKAAKDQMAKEEKILKDTDHLLERSASLNKQYWDATLGRRRYLLNRQEDRIDRANKFLEKKQRDCFEENQRLEEERAEKMRQVEEKKAMQRASSARRHREIKEHSEELLARKEAADRERQRQADEAFRRHEEELARRRKLLDEQMKQEAKRRDESREKARTRGHLNQVKVTLRPKPVLTIVEKDHEQLLKDLEERDREQRLRYEKEEAQRAAMREYKRQKRQRIEAKRETHFIDLLNDHEKERKLYKEGYEEHNKYLARFRELRAKYYAEKGEELATSVQEHMRKSDERLHEKIDEQFQHNFKRWNRRADHVMDTILGSYTALQHNADGSSPDPSGGAIPASPRGVGGGGGADE